jgi:uncharacterized protein (UPF0276 family)
MLKLAANLSDPLISLIESGDVSLDMIEVGPWYTVDSICESKQKNPDFQFLYHGSNQITGMGFKPRTIPHIRSYIECTQSPWVSMHISLLLPGVWLMYQRLGLIMPTLPIKWSIGLYRRKVSRLKRAIKVPLILENMPGLPFPGYDQESNPDTIRRILDAGGCDFLLDIAHARVAADIQNIDVYSYLAALPLYHVIQLHISGPRVHDGKLYDEHEVLQDEDYKILEWVLTQTKPKVLTLEYFRERNALSDQLKRLRSIIDWRND